MKEQKVSNLYEFPPLATGENRTTSVVLMALSILNKMTFSSSDYLFFPKANQKVCLVINSSLLA